MSEWKLGKGWDIDFLTLEINPGAVSLFAHWWGVGGSAYRSNSDPFPSGLEVASVSPFTLRVQLPGTPSDAYVAGWGQQFMNVLKALSPTYNPTLAPPPTSIQASKQLSTDTRLVDGDALARALQHASLGEFRLFVCRYGMKTCAHSFFHKHLRPVFELMAGELGMDVAQRRLQSMVADFATQAPMQGGVVAVKYVSQLGEPLPWRAKCQPYPLFGKGGHGFGGFVLSSKSSDIPLDEDGNPLPRVHKVNVYCGGWVHWLKCQGLPPTAVPPPASNSWLAKQKSKLESMLASLNSVEPIYLAGARLEIRLHGCPSDWEPLHHQLMSVMSSVLQKCQCINLAPGYLTDLATHAVADAMAGGLFSHAGDSGGVHLPLWKKRGYYRLLNVFGIMSWHSCRLAMLADASGDSWADPELAHAVPLDVGGTLMRNPTLPLGILRVPLPISASSWQVSRIGLLKWESIDWHLIARKLRQPGLHEVLARVAKQTRWRRCPLGRGGAKRASSQFTATKLVGKGMVGALGDHLAIATVNLVAMGLHDSVRKWGR
jgi:hypothetical protein